MEIFPNISKQEREKDQSFYVYLTNKRARSDNSLQFTVDLENPIDLEGVWTVGLSEISFQHCWKKCVHNPYIRIFHSNYNKDYNSSAEPNNFLNYCTNETPYVDIDISMIDFNTTDINLVMTKVSTLIKDKMSQVFDRCNSPSNTLHYEKIGFFDGIRFETVGANKRPALWFKSKHLEKGNRAQYQNLYSKVKIPPELAYLLGFQNVILKTTQKNPRDWATSDALSDYIYIPQNIVIYSDICEHSRINDGYGQILRSINIDRPFSAKICRKFNPIYYLDVLKSKIYSITINVAGLCGHDLVGLFGETLVTLHFQKKSF